MRNYKWEIEIVRLGNKGWRGGFFGEWWREGSKASFSLRFLEHLYFAIIIIIITSRKLVQCTEKLLNMNSKKNGVIFLSRLKMPNFKQKSYSLKSWKE